MKAVSQYFQRIVWFLPWEKFAIGFGMYMFASTLALIMRGAGILQAFISALTVGVVLKLIGLRLMS